MYDGLGKTLALYVAVLAVGLAVVLFVLIEILRWIVSHVSIAWV